ncbi:MAG: hypothetical protein HKO54_10025 [Flavobacteriaceae bacterium]|nr:hypothetical protein [Flavobacteriaceae bacterium]
MLKNFIKKVGAINVMMLVLVLSIIIVSEYIFVTGSKIDALFLGLWAPTILGFMIYLKPRN